MHSYCSDKLVFVFHMPWYYVPGVGTTTYLDGPQENVAGVWYWLLLVTGTWYDYYTR